MSASNIETILNKTLDSDFAKGLHTGFLMGADIIGEIYSMMAETKGEVFFSVYYCAKNPCASENFIDPYGWCAWPAANDKKSIYYKIGENIGYSVGAMTALTIVLPIWTYRCGVGIDKELRQTRMKTKAQRDRLMQELEPHSTSQP